MNQETSFNPALGFGSAGLVVTVLAVVGLWLVFAKAGRPGWAAIIPIYNVYVWLKIAGRSGWWLILLFVPLVNLVVMIVVSLDIARAFGKSGVFGFFGLFLFSVIGYLILGFGRARYTAPGPR
ncbi:DUF5684 domain-containing protein [Amycolatopsis circi]|uniref:DUF5684 domain-containing protein n=1 Tax=Amycolatopsis circi TaxID=871959 RepID=UPI000E284F49|nr:DUF5684 domain-containing protein [Amycolatopsis circi]